MVLVANRLKDILDKNQITYKTFARNILGTKEDILSQLLERTDQNPQGLNEIDKKLFLIISNWMSKLDTIMRPSESDEDTWMSQAESSSKQPSVKISRRLVNTLVGRKSKQDQNTNDLSLRSDDEMIELQDNDIIELHEENSLGLMRNSSNPQRNETDKSFNPKEIITKLKFILKSCDIQFKVFSKKVLNITKTKFDQLEEKANKMHKLSQIERFYFEAMNDWMLKNCSKTTQKKLVNSEVSLEKALSSGSLSFKKKRIRKRKDSKDSKLNFWLE